ncbi:ATP synthase subunit b, sodium ion specific [bioreactor metagenome]|jgi:F-type H+-transporting ATPase subunit b|uniref:ATP synthase subunit b, sodium ion specific n=1 Tax=bioreactor metagenome TaxID=1076179 RepID=A0A645E2U5_9ZZZZ
MEFHLIDFIEHALNLLILFLLLRHFLYKPVNKFMAEREANFAREREQLDASRNEANVLKAQYETSMKNARLDAEHIAEERRKVAEREAEDLRKKAKQDAQGILSDAMHQAVAEREGMMNELKTQTAELAVDIAGKILEREVTQEDHQRIIDSFFDKVG